LLLDAFLLASLGPVNEDAGQQCDVRSREKTTRGAVPVDGEGIGQEEDAGGQQEARGEAEARLEDIGVEGSPFHVDPVFRLSFGHVNDAFGAVGDNVVVPFEYIRVWQGTGVQLQHMHRGLRVGRGRWCVGSLRRPMRWSEGQLVALGLALPTHLLRSGRALVEVVDCTADVVPNDAPVGKKGIVISLLWSEASVVFRERVSEIENACEPFGERRPREQEAENLVHAVIPLLLRRSWVVAALPGHRVSTTCAGDVFT